MSGFIDFLKKHEKHDNIKNEETMLEQRKKTKQQLEEELIDDDDFYRADLNEAHRVQYKPVRHTKPVPRPIEQPMQEEPIIAPVRREPPVRRVMHKPEETTLQESYRSNPALNEAYSMMDKMKKKIEEMFYRYGMTGLQKLDECMIEVFEEILNPTPVVAEPRIVERVVEVPIKKKPIKKKKPTPLSKPIVKPVLDEQIDAEITFNSNINNNDIETINSNFDFEALGESLAESETVNNNTRQTLDRINRNAAVLQESMTKTTKPAPVEEEPYEQPEELEIVDETLTETETTEITETEENNEEE